MPQLTDEAKFYGLVILLTLAAIIIIGEVTGITDALISIIE